MINDNSDDDRFSPKKTVTRKKLVDLKAVAALLEEGDASNPSPVSSEGGNPGRSNYEPNEDLIQGTSRIKNQRDLILARFKKMEQGKGKVSKNVYDKVYRDYHLQIDNITALLNEKKALLEKELKKLYLLREKQTMEINRHKEILEEARFRHFLEEFSEEQYKEVEEYESREIEHLQSEIGQIHSFIRVHEELFDPKDLGLKEVTRTMAPAASRASSGPAPQHSYSAGPAPRKTPVEAKPAAEDFAEKTPLPEKRAVLPEEPAFSDTDADNYFSAEETGEGSESGVIPPPSAGTKVPAPPSPPPAPKKEEPGSIYDILEEIPLSGEEKERYVSSVTPTHVSAKIPQPEGEKGTYKLTLVESEGGEVEPFEIVLKDSISIGRSPSNDVVLKAAKVSRQHAAINRYKDQYIIIDLKSSNGVTINGKKAEEQALQDGDEIVIGGYKMIFQKV